MCFKKGDTTTIVLGWICFYDQLIFQFLAHLCAGKLAQVKHATLVPGRSTWYFFLCEVALLTCFYTHTSIILCRLNKVLSCRNFRKPIKSCYDFCASCKTKKFPSQIWVHCQETHGIDHNTSICGINTNNQFLVKNSFFTYFPTFYHVILKVVVVVIAQILWLGQILSEHRCFELCFHKLHEKMCHLRL